MRLPISLFKVPDSSMEPVLKRGQYLLVSGMIKGVSEGDLVVLKHPYRGLGMVKRVRKMEKNGYFVVSDKDIPTAEDSRHFGKVSSEHIVGKVLFRT